MATKRTKAQIENDYEKGKKYVEKHSDVISLQEVAESIGLSRAQMETSFLRHPNENKKILRKLAENRRKLNVDRKTENKTNENEKKLKSKVDMSEINTSEPANWVIDASITGTDGLKNLLSNVGKTKNKIVLTSATISELELMQLYTDYQGKDAKKILSQAAEDTENFECVLIDESLDKVDDCIIKYCADNKANVGLLTSDKVMALKARTYGVKTKYFKPNPKVPENNPKIESNKVEKTLGGSKKIGNRLLIECKKNSSKRCRVISGGKQYDTGWVEINKGDEVYIATDRKEYMTFAHYKITSISVIDNCIMVYSRRIYNIDEIENLPEQYKLFIQEFFNK